MKNTKRKTHNEFILEVQLLFPSVIINGTYTNNKTKIECVCTECGNKWEVSPNSLLSSKGCPRCSVKNRVIKRTTTHEDFISKMYSLNKNLKILNQYINSNTEIDCYCEKHDTYFTKRASSLLKYPSCKQCSSENYSKATSMKIEWFMEKFNKQHKNIEILGEFINGETDFDARCTIDGHIWNTNPNRLLRGHGCPKCVNKYVDNNDFLKRVKEADLKFIPLEEYKNNKTKLLCRCKIDGNEWMCLPNDLFKIGGCPKCKKEKMIKYLSKSHDEFIYEMSTNNKNVEIVGEYINMKNKISAKCLIHDFVWEASPSHLLNGHGCPQCKESRGEKKIRDILQKHNISFTAQKTFDECVDKNKLRFDFFLDDYNVCMEYQGQQHYKIVQYFGGEEAFLNNKRRDNIKRDFCKVKDIELIEIKYTEYKNIENIICALLKSKGVIELENYK